MVRWALQRPSCAMRCLNKATLPLAELAIYRRMARPFSALPARGNRPRHRPIWPTPCSRAACWKCFGTVRSVLLRGSRWTMRRGWCERAWRHSSPTRRCCRWCMRHSNPSAGWICCHCFLIPPEAFQRNQPFASRLSRRRVAATQIRQRGPRPWLETKRQSRLLLHYRRHRPNRRATNPLPGHLPRDTA